MRPGFPLALLMTSAAIMCAACGATAPVVSPSSVTSVSAQGANQGPPTTVLTGGTLQLYAGDPGSAHLQGSGFDLTSAAEGTWPQTVAPGTPVNFSGAMTLSDWGNVTLNGAALHGDTSGPGAGRLWIAGTMTVNATPLVAPLAAAFSGQLQTAVTVTGSISGFANANAGQAALFTTNLSGAGMISGAYRVITAANAPMFLNTSGVVLQVS